MAKKISRKHFLTLEPGISELQTNQMGASGLPAPVHGCYTDMQQGWLWSVADFIGEVQTKQ